MATKATYKGHCQVCGREQKLPRGMLSKHGYTTRCGFFEGTCFGAEHLPFEQDISLIHDAIFRAQVQAETLRRDADVARAQVDPELCWVNAYFSPMSRHDGGYRWIRTRLVRDQIGRPAYDHPGGDREGGPRVEQLPTGLYDLVDGARESNGRYADYLERKAGEIDTYVRWQEGRIKGWQPTDLTPIEEEASR